MNYFRNHLFVLSLLMTSSLVLTSCGTTVSEKLETNDHLKELAEIEAYSQTLKSKQIDVLAAEEFSEGMDNLNDAKGELEDKAKAEEILKELSEAKGLFLKAEATAKGRTSVPEVILKAREEAVKTQLSASPKLIDKLEDIDDDLRSESDEFSKSLSPEDFTELQKRYFDLEVESIQFNKLKLFRQVVSRAEEENAIWVAPKTYKAAKKDINSASNSIAQNPRKPEAYKEAVDKANRSAKLLQDVMGKLTGSAKGSSEETALELVQQERKLGKLSSTVSNLEGEVNNLSGEVTTLSSKLTNQSTDLLSAEEKVRFQEAMSSVRDNFDSTEAEVYQQGTKLIIRLKKINFAIGSAEIPEESTELLGKIDQIIEKIEPKAVEVQGHTDSTGPAIVNEALSTKRAESVATYFGSLGNNDLAISTVGFGASRPLANNEDREGRMQNRRVDIVIDAK